MFPILFQIGSVKIVTLPVVLIFAFLFGVFIFWRGAKKEYLAEIEIFDFSIVVFIGMILGGKFLEFIVSIWRFGVVLSGIRLWQETTAFSFWGAILGGFFACYLFTKAKEWKYWQILDLGSKAVAGSFILVWFGNFLAGSAYGGTTNYFWGISSPYFIGRRHPAQILGMLIFVFIFLVLVWLSRKVHFEGFQTSFFLILTSFFLFLLEFLRGDSVYLFSIRANQLFAVFFFVVGLAIFYIRSKRNFLRDLKKIPGLVISGIGRIFVLLSKIKRRLVDLRIVLKYKLLSLKRRK